MSNKNTFLRKVTIYLLTSCNTEGRIAQNIYINNSNRNYKKLTTTTLIKNRIGIGYKNYGKQCPKNNAQFIIYSLTMIALLILEVFLMVLHIDRFVKIVVSVDRSKYNCRYSNYPLVSC